MRTADLVASRELLWNLTLRELRGKYKRSALGWAWSMLNPLATMGIYTFVFGLILKQTPSTPMGNGDKVFAFYLLCGLLPWNFLALTTGMAMGSLVANAGLVRKVWFPRETLVLSAAGSTFVSFLIEMGLVCVALVIVGNMVLPWLPVVLVLMVLIAAFAVGLGLVLAAVNVYFRDLSYLWGIFTQLWFFATPIVYPAELVSTRIHGWVLRLYDANPMAVYARTFRRAMYQLKWPGASDMAQLVAWSAVVLAVGLWTFAKLSPRFAEEL